MGERSAFDAADAQRMARRMKRVNVPMRLVLGMPFPTPLGGRLMLVYFTGRKTGRPYRQPVSYVRDGDVLLTPGGGKWKLNLRTGEPVMIRLRGRDVTAWPELVRNFEEVDRLLRQMMAQNPRLTSFVPFIGSDGAIDRANMQTALEHGFCIVRWRLAPVPSSS
jgi:deazaflavin-dependent oxidoreductase (nitroreductase family)